MNNYPSTISTTSPENVHHGSQILPEQGSDTQSFQSTHYQELHSLRESGDVESAYQRGHELLNLHPNDRSIKVIFGWILYDKIKQIVDQVDSDDSDSGELHEEIRRLFQEYARLRSDRPDQLFSFMVELLLELPELPHFSPQILYWAGIHSYRPEDFEHTKSSDDSEKHPSLVERLAYYIGQQVVFNWKDYERTVQEFSVALIDKALEMADVSDPLWLRYFKGRILCELGREEIAREHLLYVLDLKREEDWAWHAVARCERRISPSTALSLCAKAYFLAKGKKNDAIDDLDVLGILDVLEDIVELSIELRDYQLAKWAVDRQVSILQKNEWTSSESMESLDSLITSDWYSSTTDLANPEQSLKEVAESKEDNEFLFDGKWSKVTLLESFTSKIEKRFLKLIYEAIEDSSQEIVVPVKDYPHIKNLESGTPLYAAIGYSEDLGHYRILSLKPREDGRPYDCLIEVNGILDHHNRSKEMATIFISPTTFTILRYSQFEEVRNWKPGTPLVMSCINYRDRRYIAYEVNLGTFQESDLATQQTGELFIHERGFGFVNDVYVPAAMVRGHAYGSHVNVIALKKPKIRTGVLGWQAILIEPATTAPYYD